MRRIVDLFIMTVLLCSLMGFTSVERRDDYISKARTVGSPPAEYLVKRALDTRIILVGTHHKDADIHRTIIDAMPELYSRAGVKTLFVEISSDEQSTIDRFLDGRKTVEDIKLWDIIKSKSYCEILLTARKLEMDVVAVDKPMNLPGTRDSWMAARIKNHLRNNPESKAMVIAGARHVFKDLKWNFTNEPSLADYLKSDGGFSVIIWPDSFDLTCALGMDATADLFEGVKDPTLMALNISNDECLMQVTDGIILIPRER